MIRGGLLTPPFARFLIILITLAALPTCGVELKETFEGTEVFKGIALSGERVAGGELTLTLTVRQGYAVPVRIEPARGPPPPGWPGPRRPGGWRGSRRRPYQATQPPQSRRRRRPCASMRPRAGSATPPRGTTNSGSTAAPRG